MAGAGIERVVSTRGGCSGETAGGKQVVEEGLSCRRAGGEGSNSMEAGGKRGLQVL